MKVASRTRDMDPREEVVACQACGLVQTVPPLRPRASAHCARCGSVVTEYRAGSVAPTAALALAGLVLYVPANVYPVLRMELYGAYTESTIWSGVVSLLSYGYWFVAAVVFVASMVVPLLKLLGLFFLAVTTQLGTARWRRARTALHRFVDVIGPWAMLDVFLVAVLVAAVRLGSLATILPGRGLAAFAAVVVLTMLASAVFDPRLIWRRA